jgi:beta-N-acetylhexosaminidase
MPFAYRLILSLLAATMPSFSLKALADTNEPAALASLPLGQLLIVGFKGTQLNEGLEEVLRETKPGGILLFGRNVKSAEQVGALNFAAQTLSKKITGKPLLIAIDQEGGNVIRIRNAPTLPSALAISKTRDLTVARRAGSATGRLLKSLGINMNLAPVVDVSDPDTDGFLGTRSFGNDPGRVAAMTTALSNGLQENGVMPVAKHFPGHGNAGDSHLVIASSKLSRDQLMKRDLIPYQSLAKYMKKPWGAMLAHVSFPEIDESGAPATFSKPIVKGIFRQDVSASALVMTDDIEMAGAGAEANVGQRAVRAIEAGADMVMIAWSRKIQREVTTAIAEAVASGRIKRSRIEEALRHIARAKAVYVPEVLKLATKEELTRSLKNPDFTMLGDAVLRSAVRNLDERRAMSDRKTASTQNNFGAAEDLNNQAAPPVPARLKPGGDPVIVLSARLDFLIAFKERANGFDVKTAVLKPSRKEAVERLLRANPESPVFAYVSGRQVASFISELDDSIAAKMVLVNIETKASIDRPERYRDIFDVHYRHPELGKTVAESYLEINEKTASLD